MSTRFIKYVEGKSPVHKLDPRAKLTFIFLFVLSLTLTFNIALLVPLLVISLFFYLLADLPWSRTKETWKFILIITVALSALNYLTIAVLYSGASTTGKLLVKLSSPKIILEAATPVVKLLTLAIATATLVFTTSPNLYAPALGQMGFSYKQAYVIQLALRYVPEFIDEMKKTLEAQMARGFRPKGGKNPILKLLALVPLVVPVTISATLSIYDIADAMELRGFGEERCHTWYRELRLSKLDKAVVVSSFILGVLYTVLFVMRTLGYL